MIRTIDYQTYSLYNLRMTNQTITKPIGLIKNLKIYSHGILHIVTFIVIQNNVLDVSFSMLLSSPRFPIIGVQT
jgi:hypothetical protein